MRRWSASFQLVIALGNADARAEKVPAFNNRWLQPFFATGPLKAPAERFRAEEWTVAAEGFSQALVKLPRTSPEYLPGRFVLAVARMNLSQWTDAAAMFEDLATSYPVLTPYHAYYAARCHLRAGNGEAALAWADRVPAKSVPEAEAVLIKLEALGQRRWGEVESEAQRFLDRFPNGPRRVEASFRRAKALEAIGRAAEAVPALPPNLGGGATGELVNAGYGTGGSAGRCDSAVTGGDDQDVDRG